MDANGTRLQVVLGRDDWSRWLNTQGRLLGDVWATDGDSDSPSWAAASASVTLAPRLSRFHAPAGVNLPSVEERRGGARDRYGNWYWIAHGGREVRVWSAGSQTASHLWSVGEASTPAPPTASGSFQPQLSAAAPPAELRGVAVTEDHYLVLGVVDPAGLLIFDLHAGRPPVELVWPSGVPFSPFDLAARPGGGVWVLDRIHARYWGLDRWFAVIPQGPVRVPPPGSFTASDGSAQPIVPERSFPPGVPLAAASPPRAIDPIAIEALPDGCSVLILDAAPGRPFSFIQRGTADGLVGSPVSTAEFARFIDVEEQADLDLSALDFTLVPAAPGTPTDLGRLYVLASDGAQAFAFDASLSASQPQQLQLEPVEQYLPLRLSGGTGLTVAGGQPYYDFGDRWLALVEQQRPRYTTSTLLDSSIATPLDGREPDCVWHRLMLDGCVPAETGIQVWSRASNTVAGLQSAEWSREPDPVRRPSGSEQPFTDSAWTNSDPRRGTSELLFQQARGRYLQLRLGLVGNGRATPSIRALRAYYPRFSYRDHYLPGAYREDERSASFVERFLANFEGVYTSIEDHIAGAQVLLDPVSAPSDAVDWLGTWFGLVLDPNWDTCRRRLLVSHAMQLFQQRGTPRGIEMALRLAMDQAPDVSIFEPGCVGATGIRLVEDFRAKGTSRVAIGDPTGLPGQAAAATTTWSPVQGALNLNQRFRQFLLNAAPDAQPARRFPLTAPGEQGLADSWLEFASQTLGFVPSANSADLDAWRDFLARRYVRIAALNAAYGRTTPDIWPSFDVVPLPAALPTNAAALEDWYQFERIVVPTRRHAHRFTVLLPLAPGNPLSPQQRIAQLALAQRLIELQKPAHTIASVMFYWAIFRLGEVRLGEDTRLQSGSRAPELAPDVVLQHTALAEAFLSVGYAPNPIDRDVLGRDHLPQMASRSPQGNLQ